MSTVWVPCVDERVDFNSNNLVGCTEISIGWEKTKKPSNILGLSIYGCEEKGETISEIECSWSFNNEREGSGEARNVVCGGVVNANGGGIEGSADRVFDWVAID